MSRDVPPIPGAGSCQILSALEGSRDVYLTSESEGLTPELRKALQSVETCVAQMNESLRHAVEAGVTIELRRRHRVHSGDGCWADQMMPLIQARQRP